MWKIGFVLLMLHQLLVLPDAASSFSLGLGENSDAEAGLYNVSDYVVALNRTNFKNTVYGSKRAYLVEFYNSWCGFCIKYAPIWKRFAKTVHSWSNIVVIAAVDCANNDNLQMCRDYDIVVFPTLKFFSANSQLSNQGSSIKKHKDETSLIGSLIETLETEQLHGRGIDWPNLAPIRGNSFSNLWTSVSEDIQFQFIIFEDPQSHLGATVILNLNRIDSIKVRRVISDNEALCVASKVNKFPSLILLNRDQTHEALHFAEPTGDSIGNSIKDFLLSKGISVELKSVDIEDFDDQIEIAKQVLDNQQFDKLYESDLLNAVQYSLYQEVQYKKIIYGEEIVALKNFLRALANYFPVRSGDDKQYFTVLENLLDSQRKVSNEMFREFLSKADDMIPGYLSKRKWIGCKSYPCGLWILFHLLTVEAASDSEQSTVLRTIHGYIKNFFGCAECKEHFTDMANRRRIFDVKEGNESILWLWKAHNEVNERLAKELSSGDENHKKVQYPSPEVCPQCRHSNGSWSEDEILKFLKFQYSRSNVLYQSVELNDSVVQPFVKKPLALRSSWDFTVFDISICVVLYVISAGILILVCIKFAVKKSRRRKVSLAHLFGAVRL